MPECCSFCKKTRKQVKVLIRGKHAFICNLCVGLAQTPLARVAHCVECTVVNGKHDPECPEAT
ncbi:hypothetical protein AKJ09_00063 [Labilithrix luteola]|uniref:ClpX-type ZB domain-containing protein n=1 Tax=Labilithrix luteola TaxID=1391654 RepID=A0A0K1PJW2_9BACT|nr:hypothetical protein AKJ09_00063 [Labilithrix luteola]